jgi:hypothetical protein
MTLPRFKSELWTPYYTELGSKAVRDGKDKDHWTTRAWMNRDGALIIEAPCEGSHIITVLPREVLTWLAA